MPMLAVLGAIAVTAPIVVAPAPSAAQTQAPMEIKGATTVDAEKVITLIDGTKNLVIIDNRRTEDYGAGHIEGAIRVLDTDLTEAKMAELVPTKDRPCLFYCNGLACGRAAKAAEKAVGWGYTKVHYYALGMDEWKKLGLPLTVAQ
ncbi:MAG: rhodanese-like domain-containing protein [Alphaproteobacteria bacterium]